MKTEFGDAEMGFWGPRESFYMASLGETGWPYMQHRGGAAGFLTLLSAQEFGWAKYAGNRQYIPTGNIAGDDRVSLFFMGYAAKTRLKVYGHARGVGADDPVMGRLSEGSGGVQVERGMIVRLASYEWNCPKYITQRYTKAEVQQALAQMGARIAELETALAAKG